MQLSGNTVQNHNMSAVIEGTRFRSLPLCVSDGCAFTHGTVVERSVPCRPPQWLPVNSCLKMILLLGLIFILWVEPGLCLEEDGRFTFDGDIRQFVVTTDMVYAATKETLYQLRRKLTEPRSLTLRGLLKDGINAQERQFYRVSDTSMWNTTFQIHVLLPFVANKSLISCGMSVNGCGYCELLDLDNIHNVLYSENIQVGPVESSSASVAFLVDIKNSGTYILTAIQTNHTQSDKCSTSCQTVNLHDKDNARDEGIFSLSDNIITPSITSIGDVEFVDGFQVGSTIYLLSNNVLPGSRNNEVRLIWLQGESSKTETLKSLRGATLVVSEVGARGSRLVASSVIPGGPMLWSGVFSVNGDQTNTELVVFDISPDLTGTANQDPHFCYGVKNCPESKSMPKTLKPTAVLLRQKHMTSVLAVRHRAWMVFYMGTSDGQLIKLVVDKHYHTACPRVLYRANDNQPVFPKLHLDQVDHKHVYVALRKQMMRVPVSNCSTFTNAQKCLSAQDPNCVWCQSKHSCTFEDDCKDSDWLSIPEDLHNNVVSHKLERNDAGQLKLMVRTHVTMSQMNASNFACHFVVTSDEMCIMTNIPPQFPQCTCRLKRGTIPDEGLNFTFKFRLGTVVFAEQLKLNNCSNIRGPSSSHLCEHCVKSGCGWSTNGCSWANQGVGNDSVCQTIKSEINSLPKISSISPRAVSFYGRNHAVLSGYNLSDVTRVRIQRDSACTAQESPVWNNTGVNLTFHIPSSDHNGEVTVCVVLPDGSCHGNYGISYQSSPFCTRTEPSSTWFSGKRTITLIGSHLEFVEGVIHSHNPQEITLPRSSNSENLTYETAAAKSTPLAFFSSVFLKVANKTLTCPSDFKYHPDPEFITFTSQKTGDDILITLEKKKDELEMTEAEVSVWGVHSGKQYPCIQIIKDISNKTELFRCHIKNSPNAKFQQLKIKYGDKTVVVQSSSSLLFPLMLSVFFVIPVIIVVVVIIYRRKQKKFTARMNKIMENLELDIRNDIRQGFVDLQTERADLIENVGTIPFLDYKHFACRIFFPESDSLMTSCIKEIGQDAVTVQLDECCQDLSRLIQDQLFLTSMVHALEEQKSFTIKDKCALASLLTVALHSNLSYLTEVMEVLLKDLMQQNSNSQPKLLLRRTESTVEKLLTNWMSICLYGFLRESVGQHLFLMVSALTQQIAKGPVDCVTEKALYTLNEDWLLWQAPDFTSLKLKVLFAVGSDGEVSEPLEVNSLSCDTVEQVKEKVLSTFRAKFGFPYKTHLRDIRIEYEQDGSFLPLEEVDASSEVIEEVTMLNTLKHYKIPDGATIKVLSKSTHPPLSPQGSLKDDENFSGKYFHLIDPDVVEDQRKSPERKKLKLKEVHLTKLLSTKVAVHSFVENLFKSICGMQFNKAPVAVKYFFDFLDSQAENMKITDPDVLHIWKTNSLLLRFWVNILKNPQFIFDMEKTPHLDSCLSVITQAFMDSFSLSELQLGKHAPTNRLLYAKDIPKFKQEVKVYYKRIKEQSPVTDAEFTSFLQEESMKHENEFNEAGALRELYKFIQKYFKEIKDKLEQNGAPTELTEQLHHVKNLFDKLKSCSWN